MISMKLQEVAVIELGPRNPLHASRQAPGEPGRQKMNLPLATPAVARDWTVEGPIFGHDTMWKQPRSSISFSNRNRKADRDVAPRQTGAAGGQDDVDVVAFQPVAGDAADLADVVLDDRPPRQLMTSGGDEVEITWPDRSVSRVRVSDTVITAIRTGMKGRSSVLALS